MLDVLGTPRLGTEGGKRHALLVGSGVLTPRPKLFRKRHILDTARSPQLSHVETDEKAAIHLLFMRLAAHFLGTRHQGPSDHLPGPQPQSMQPSAGVSHCTEALRLSDLVHR